MHIIAWAKDELEGFLRQEPAGTQMAGPGVRAPARPFGFLENLRPRNGRQQVQP